MGKDYELYDKLKETFQQTIEKYNLKEHSIEIKGAVLSVKEAIGNPERQDFPLQKGKEKLMQASFRGYYGQAFTDMPRDFSGKLKDIVSMPINNNYDRAVFVSSLNAVAAYLKVADHTIHCKDEDPHKCSLRLVEKIKSEYNDPKIAFFGLQPAMVEALAGKFEMRVFDLNPDNIGKEKFGVRIESGECDLIEVEKWADLFVVTGSTVCNDTLTGFLSLKKPVIYFGTTIAGTAAIMGLERFCPNSRSELGVK